MAGRRLILGLCTALALAVGAAEGEAVSPIPLVVPPKHPPLSTPCYKCLCFYGQANTRAGYKKIIELAVHKGVTSDEECVKACKELGPGIYPDGTREIVIPHVTCATFPPYNYEILQCESLGCSSLNHDTCVGPRGLPAISPNRPFPCRCPLVEATAYCDSCNTCQCVYQGGPGRTFSYPHPVSYPFCAEEAKHKCLPNVTRTPHCNRQPIPPSRMDWEETGQKEAEQEGDYDALKTPPPTIVGDFTTGHGPQIPYTCNENPGCRGCENVQTCDKFCQGARCTCNFIEMRMTCNLAPDLPYNYPMGKRDGEADEEVEEYNDDKVYDADEAKTSHPEKEELKKEEEELQNEAPETATVVINSAVDNGVCDEGGACDLRGAWLKYGPGLGKSFAATFVLSVDPVLDHGLYYANLSHPIYYPGALRELSIVSSSPGTQRTVTASGKGYEFMRWTNLRQGTVSFTDIVIDGFVRIAPAPFNSGIVGGGLTIIAGEFLCTTCRMEVVLTRVTLRNCGLRLGLNNTMHTLASGGAMGVSGTSGVQIVKLIDTKFENNFIRPIEAPNAFTHDQSGGAMICTPNCELSVKGTTFRNSSVLGTNYYSNGGHVFHYGSTATFENCSFEGASGAQVGAAVDSGRSTSMNFTNCTFRGNKGPADLPSGGYQKIGDRGEGQLPVSHVSGDKLLLLRDCVIENADSRLAATATRPEGIVLLDGTLVRNMDGRVSKLAGGTVYNRNPRGLNLEKWTGSVKIPVCVPRKAMGGPLPCVAPFNLCFTAQDPDGSPIGYYCKRDDSLSI